MAKTTNYTWAVAAANKRAAAASKDTPAHSAPKATPANGASSGAFMTKSLKRNRARRRKKDDRTAALNTQLTAAGKRKHSTPGRSDELNVG